MGLYRTLAFSPESPEMSKGQILGKASFDRRFHLFEDNGLTQGDDAVEKFLTRKQELADKVEMIRTLKDDFISYNIRVRHQ